MKIWSPSPKKKGPMVSEPGTDASAAGAPRFSLKGKRVWVAGHRGMVGAALVRDWRARSAKY